LKLQGIGWGYEKGRSPLHLREQVFFIYLLDITNILFLNTVSLLLNILSPLVYKLFKGIRVKGFGLCTPVIHHLLYLIICKSLTSWMSAVGAKTDSNQKNTGLDYGLCCQELPDSVSEGHTMSHSKRTPCESSSLFCVSDWLQFILQHVRIPCICQHNNIQTRRTWESQTPLAKALQPEATV
jgi:hypothetical protein